MSLTELQYEECKQAFTDLKEEAFNLNHYQLAEITDIKNPLQWREFLLDARTVDYISSEMSLIRNAAINYMVQNAPGSNSVGQSQLINALQKIDETSTEKKGPAFIYCFVPLNEAQKMAPNVREIKPEGEKIKEGEFVLTIDDPEDND